MSKDVSFASFNLFNFQAVGKKARGSEVSQDVYAKKLEWTRRAVIDLDADVIAFQELWSRSCLDDVFSCPELKSYQIEYIKDGTSDPWYDIANAVAIRRPWIKNNKTLIKDFPFVNLVKVERKEGLDDEVEVKIRRFSRTIIRLSIGNEKDGAIPEFELFAAHLKSKLPASVPNIPSQYSSAMGSAISTIRRTAEAAAIRWILTDSMRSNDKPHVLVGDLNDDPRSNTLALITQQPSMAASASGGDDSLYSVLQFEQLKSYRDVFYTHEFNRLKDSIDHILVSQEFFANSRKCIWAHKNTRIWNDHVDDMRDHTSDHGIIKASFRYVGR